MPMGRCIWDFRVRLAADYSRIRIILPESQARALLADLQKVLLP